MNLYFRAWHKKNKEMHNITGIAFGAKVVELSSPYDRNPVCKFDEVILMQGIEIKGKVIYEGDIVEVKSLIDANYKDRAVIEDIIELNYLRGYDDIQVIGNVYENKELV